MKNKLIALSLAVAGVCLGVPASWAQTAPHMMLNPADLKWADATLNITESSS